MVYWKLPQQKLSDRTILLFLLSHKTHMKACVFLCSQFSPKLLFPSHPRMNVTYALNTIFLLTYHCLPCGASSNPIPLGWWPHTPVRAISFFQWLLTPLATLCKQIAQHLGDMCGITYTGYVDIFSRWQFIIFSGFSWKCLYFGTYCQFYS